MTATGHALLGVVIAAKITNPYLAVPVAIISHVLGDILPHWDTGTHSGKKTRKRLFIDAFVDVSLGFVASFALLYFVFPQTDPLYATSMIIASQGLDWVTAPYLFFRIKIPPFTWFYRFQKFIENQLDKPWGIVTQAGVVLVAIIAAKAL